jgi:hypothetical protein
MEFRFYIETVQDDANNPAVQNIQRVWFESYEAARTAHDISTALNTPGLQHLCCPPNARIVIPANPAVKAVDASKWPAVPASFGTEDNPAPYATAVAEAFPPLQRNPQYDSNEFERALQGFIEGAQAKVDAYWTAAKFTYDKAPRISQQHPRGPRYIRIVRTDNDGSSRSVYVFIDHTNGDILKGSWKAPVKNGVRGSVFADDFGLSCVDSYGTKYLR